MMSELFRTMVENVADYAIFLVDLQGNVASWNIGARRIFGYSDKEILGRSSGILFVPEDRKRHIPEKELEKAFAAGRAMDDRWHLRKDGSRFYASGITIALRDEGGPVRGFAKITRDITERKRIEEALREQERNFRALFELSGIGQVQVELPSLRFILINRKFAAMFGYSEEELRTLTLADLLHPEELSRLLAHFTGAGSDPAAEYETELVCRHKNGESLWMRLNAVGLTHSDGRASCIAAAFQDVTANRRYQEELQRINAELNRRHKVRAEFTSMVSHEIKTPLAAIRESVELVRDGVDGPVTEDQKETLELARNNVDRLARLIDNVLDISRIESGRFEIYFEPVEVQALVRESCDLLKRNARRKGIEFAVRLPAEPIRAEWDPDKIKQLLINLIDNAIKYTDRGGRVKVDVATADHDVVIEVSDTGRGISAENLERIFELFEREVPEDKTRMIKGSGIGLAIARKIVDVHRGRIAVQSEPGRGSTFHVSLPLHPAETKFHPPQ